MELRHEILQENSHPWKKQIFFCRDDNIQKAHVDVVAFYPLKKLNPILLFWRFSASIKSPTLRAICAAKGFFQRCICNRQLPNFSILVISKIIISSLWKCHSDMPSTHGLCSTFIQGVSFEPLLNGGSSIQIENWMIRRNYYMNECFLVILFHSAEVWITK